MLSGRLCLLPWQGGLCLVQLLPGHAHLLQPRPATFCNVKIPLSPGHTHRPGTIRIGVPLTGACPFGRLLSTAPPSQHSGTSRRPHLNLLSFSSSLNPLHKSRFPTQLKPLLSRPLGTLLLLNISQFSVLRLPALSSEPLSSEALASLGLGTTLPSHPSPSPVPPGVPLHLLSLHSLESPKAQSLEHHLKLYSLRKSPNLVL